MLGVAGSPCQMFVIDRPTEIGNLLTWLFTHLGQKNLVNEIFLNFVLIRKKLRKIIRAAPASRAVIKKKLHASSCLFIRHTVGLRCNQRSADSLFIIFYYWRVCFFCLSLCEKGSVEASLAMHDVTLSWTRQCKCTMKVFWRLLHVATSSSHPKFS